MGGRLDISTLISLGTNPKYSAFWAVLIWIADVVLCSLIVEKVPYTEIDWKAYMAQVTQVVQGERDYLQIKGDTGPLVYPATHVWIFRALYYLTDNGSNVKKAQYFFMGLYLITLALVLRIYIRSKVPPYVLPLLTLSKRLHSIYLLRLFNDCFGTLAAVIAVSFLQSRKWKLSAIIFSIAISIKMNALLFLPGVGIIYLHALGFNKSVLLGIPMALVQIITAWPFLRYEPTSYISRAFEFSRVFLYKWTVNWRFINEDTFLSKEFSLSLLSIHISLLVAFCLKWWRIQPSSRLIQNPHKIFQIVAISNLIGILCARSLHYQFYCWFQWTIPFLLWNSSIPFPISALIYFAEEYAWNVFPSTPLSSAVAVGSLVIVIITNYWS